MKEGKRFTIGLYRKIVEDTGLPDECILAYVALRCVSQKSSGYPYYYVSPNMLKFQLTGKLPNDRRLEEKISAGLKKLHQKGLIKIAETAGHNALLDLSGIDLDTKAGNFTIVYLDEVNCILNSGFCGRCPLLRHFILRIGSINHWSGKGEPNDFFANEIGTQTIDSLRTMSGRAKKTVIGYDKKLEELGLLYIRSPADAIIGNDGKITSSFANAYGRPEHKDAIDAFQRERELKLGNMKVRIPGNANKKRGMKQKYNYTMKIIKDGSFTGKDIPRAKEVAIYYKDLNEALRKRMEGYKEKGGRFDRKAFEGSLVDLKPITDYLEENKGKF